MSYHGKLQALKNGTADVEIQQWAYQQLEKEKTLTDEEIKSEAKYFCHSYHSENPERLVLFARAILRKAQEQ